MLDDRIHNRKLANGARVLQNIRRDRIVSQPVLQPNVSFFFLRYIYIYRLRVRLNKEYQQAARVTRFRAFIEQRRHYVCRRFLREVTGLFVDVRAQKRRCGRLPAIWPSTRYDVMKRVSVVRHPRKLGYCETVGVDVVGLWMRWLRAFIWLVTCTRRSTCHSQPIGVTNYDVTERKIAIVTSRRVVS